MKLELLIILFIISYIAYNRLYKQLTVNTTNYKILTVCIEFGGAFIALIFTCFFKFKWPTNYKIYLLIIASSIFYAICDRLNTIIRSKTEPSTFMILRQLATIFLIIIGFIFLKEQFIIEKFIGSVLIIIGNIIAFVRNGKIIFNRYSLLAIISNLCLAIALLIDVNLSNYFNLSFYVFLILFIPGLIIMIFEKIKINNIKEEIKKYDYKLLIITSTLNTTSIILQLLAYKNGNVVIVAPLCSLTIIIDVIYGLCFKNEKNGVLNKIIAAILVIIGIVLINML